MVALDPFSSSENFITGVQIQVLENELNDKCVTIQSTPWNAFSYKRNLDVNHFG